MRDIVNAAIGGQRFAMQTLGVFGAVALLLSAIGIFGIVSQVVASRTQEFGIRAALGATPRNLLLLSLGSGVRQAGAGLINCSGLPVPRTTSVMFRLVLPGLVAN